MKTFIDEMARQQFRTHGRAIPDELIPSESEIAIMIDCALWATTVADEGRYPRFSLVYGSPPEGALCVEERELTPTNIAKLAPVLLPEVSRIGVHRSKAGGLRIWGISPGYTSCFEILGLGPGQVLARMAPYNIAVFRHNEYISLVRTDPDDHASGSHGLGLASLAGLIAGAFRTSLSPARAALTGILLLQAIRAARMQGNGGTILVLPSDPSHREPAERWLDFSNNRVGGVALQRCIEKYEDRLKDAKSAREAVMKACEIDGLGEILWPKHGVDRDLVEPASVIGRLTGMDGAVTLSEELEILGFATMIRQPLVGATACVDRIFRRSFLHYDSALTPGSEVEISRVGGARRQNAARFVANNYDTLALTISHDGPITLAMWLALDPETQAPRAHLLTDLETLLP